MQEQKTSSLVTAQMIRQFGVGLTFSSRNLEDCCIYTAKESDGTKRLILHNRSLEPAKVSLKFLDIERKTRASMTTVNRAGLAEKVVDVVIDKNQVIEIPAESVFLIMIPA